MFQKPEDASAKPGVPPVFLFLLAIAVIFVAFNVYLLIAPTLQSQPANNTARGEDRQPVLLYAQNCEGCFPLEDLAVQLFPSFQRISFSNQTGKALVEQYSVSKLPTLVIFNSTSLPLDPQLASLLTRRGDVVLIEAPSVPFFDVSSGKIKGVVNAFSISPSNCSQCVKPEALLNELRSNGVLLQLETLAENSSAANELIAKYNLTAIPAFVFSRDLLEYQRFKQTWNELGSIEKDGFLVLRRPLAPFKNLSTGAIEGLVNITYLTHSACPTCYNVSLHQNVLKNFNIYAANETFIDYASTGGKALVARYNITKIPTILMSREASAYYTLQKVWPTAGSIEQDGTYIFRKFETAPGLTYTDLTANSTVTVPAT